MKRSFFTCALLALAALAPGCARKLTLANFQALEIGRTTGAEVIALIGEPDAKQRIVDGDRVYELYEFRFDDEPTMAKSGEVELLNDRVNAAEFFSVGAAHPLDGEKRTAEVISKRSTKADVERLLGRPATKARRPTLMRPLAEQMPPAASELWKYYWFRTGFMNRTMKQHVIYFDAKGTVLSQTTRETQ